MTTSDGLSSHIASRYCYRVDHTGLVVSDLNDAIDFFTSHLNAHVKFRMNRYIDPTGAAPRRLGAEAGSFALAMLSLDGVDIELLQWWGAAGTAIEDLSAARFPDRVGAAHLGIEVPDVADVLAVLRQSDAVTVVGEPVTFDTGVTPGLTNAFVWTRFGLLLELMSWPGESTSSSN